MKLLRRIGEYFTYLFFSAIHIFTRQGRKTFAIGMRNLTRYKRRTLITVLAITVALGFYFLIDGMLFWADYESRINIVNHETSHMKIMTRKYYEDIDLAPVGECIPDPDRVIRLLEGEDLIVTTRIQAVGSVVDGEGRSLPYAIIGVDAKTDPLVYTTSEEAVAGIGIPEGRSFVMGTKGTNRLNTRLGHYYRIEARTRYGQHQVIPRMELVGILDVPSWKIDKMAVFVPIELLDSADDGLRMEGAVTEIAIRMKGDPTPEELQEKKARVAEKLEKAGYDDLVVVDWRELAIDYIKFHQMKSGGGDVFSLLVFLIAAVGIVNTMLMAVFERIKEIGTLRAMGMKPKEIVAAFVYESIGIGILGSIAGVALGAGLIALLRKNGLDFGALYGDIATTMEIPYRTTWVFRAMFNPKAFVQGPIAAIMAAALTSIIPASRGMRVQVTDALRWE